MKSKALQWFNDFTVLNNGAFIVTDDRDQVIRLTSSVGKESVVIKKKTLHPTYISKTRTNDILISLRDDWDNRRLVQQITHIEMVVRTYEFRDDGTTRLFAVPYRTAENRNIYPISVSSTVPVLTREN